MSRYRVIANLPSSAPAPVADSVTAPGLVVPRPLYREEVMSRRSLAAHRFGGLARPGSEMNVMII